MGTKYYVLGIEYCEEIADFVKPTKYQETIFALATTDREKLQYSIEEPYVKEYFHNIRILGLFSNKGNLKCSNPNYEIIQPLIKTDIYVNKVPIASCVEANWYVFETDRDLDFAREVFVSRIYYRDKRCEEHWHECGQDITQ